MSDLRKKYGTAFGAVLIFINFIWIFVIGLGWFNGDGKGAAKTGRVTSLSLTGNMEGKYMLLYFGYVGCDTSCPVSLDVMATVYDSYRERFGGDDLIISFASLDKEDHPESVESYARAFHDDFRGLHISQNNFHRVIKDFAVFYSPSIREDNSLSHTSFIRLLKRNSSRWEILYTYLSYPPDPVRIMDDLKKLETGSVKA